ncbi:MAG: GlxA family transcriptional regulator [Myxococcota bacterium]
MLTVTVVLVEGGMPSTAVAPIEIFGSAGRLWNSMKGQPPRPLFSVRTASMDGRPVKSATPLQLEPCSSIEEVESSDVVIVSAPAADIERACREHRRLYPWLRARAREGSMIAGVCAGVALLAEAGLLDGLPATTHWGVAESCRRRFPQVRWQPERLLTESGKVLCSGGVYAAVDLSLYLVEKLCGHRVAMETARALLIETPRTWQVGYAAAPPATDHEDAAILRAQEFIFRHFAEEQRVQALARRAGMTARTFTRRFKAATGETPLSYLHRVRINAARHLLENDQQAIVEVAHAVGYEDLSFFRRLFRRYTGTSPRSYRVQFGVGGEPMVARAGRASHR